MKQNPFRKSFTFEQNFYNAVMEFINEDRAKNEDKNFNVMYVHVVNELFKVCNEHFAGKEYVMSLMEREPGKKSWKRSVDADTNFGNVWECVVNKFLKNISFRRYESWPNGKSEFPDFSTFGIVSDMAKQSLRSYDENAKNIRKQFLTTAQIKESLLKGDKAKEALSKMGIKVNSDETKSIVSELHNAGADTRSLTDKQKPAFCLFLISRILIRHLPLRIMYRLHRYQRLYQDES